MTREASRRRRKYLCDKTAAAIIVATFGFASLFAVAFTALTVLHMWAALSWGGYRDWNTLPPPDDGGLIGNPAGWTIFDLLDKFGPWLFGGLLATVVLSGCWIWARARVKSIPYVPPVREHTGDLPAEEVLLRGSVRPSASEAQL